MIFEKNFVRNVFVPVKFEKKELPVTAKLTESEKQQIEAICDETERTMSFVMRALMLRGLALYQRDGKLRDEGTAGVRAAEVRLQKAPVVARISPAEPTKDDVRRMITSEQEDAIARQLKPRKRKTR